MALTIQLPAEIEQNLRRELGNLDQAGKEAMLVELYRQDKLTHYELSRALGISRLETEAVLKKHDVTEDLPTRAEIEEDLRSLRRLLEQK
ncbi:MAG: UPF0175 family protein [Tepidisphaeraceae bacterium]